MNGELNGAFTLRKRLVEIALISDLDEELFLVGLISLRFKKSSISWKYREYISDCILNQFYNNIAK